MLSSVCLEKVTANLPFAEVGATQHLSNRESRADLEGDGSVEAARLTSSLLFLPAAPWSVK